MLTEEQALCYLGDRLEQELMASAMGFACNRIDEIKSVKGQVTESDLDKLVVEIKTIAD